MAGQQGADGKEASRISAAAFVINVTTLAGGPMGFSELTGINSKVDATEYLECDPKSGFVFHTKQYGKTSPPTITLKRGIDSDGNNRLLAWHLMARNGDPNAAGIGTLDVYNAAGLKTIGYTISGAWCQELTIAGVKAGDSAVPTIEVKIACTEIKAAM